MTLELQPVRNVLTNYGPRVTDQSKGGKIDLNSLVQTGIWEFTFDNLPTPGPSNLQLVIPANSTILSANLRVLEPWTSTSTTTDWIVGLQESDGTEIDNNGLVTATQATEATMQVVGRVLVGSGALIYRTIGAIDAELVVSSTVDDVLTGRAEVIVEWLLPSPTAA